MERASSDVWYEWMGSYKVTVFCFNAWARCRAPSSLIELSEMLSCVSVYGEMKVICKKVVFRVSCWCECMDRA